MNAPIKINTNPDALRNYLLAEIRCAELRARIAAEDLGAICLVLKCLISPHQALGHIEETDASRFLGALPEKVHDRQAL